jgi:chitinase
MTNPIQLEGSPEQVRELHSLLVAQKAVLFSLGGGEAHTDMLLEQRMQKASYWIEVCESKLNGKGE